MSHPDLVRKHLLDIERVIVELEDFSRGKTFEVLLADRGLQLIFEREFEVLGEAMNRLLRQEGALEHRITDARRIIGLRNILSHGYDSVDCRVLWSAVVEHLPVLKKEIDVLLQGG